MCQLIFDVGHPSIEICDGSGLHLTQKKYIPISKSNGVKSTLEIKNGVKSTLDPCSKLIRVKSRLDPSDHMTPLTIRVKSRLCCGQVKTDTLF